MKKYLKLFRVNNYIKNLIVLMPLFFHEAIIDLQQLVIAIVGSIIWCFLSSAIYIVNDIYDVKKDKEHPVKCKRPIANGEVSIYKARVISFFLFVFSFLLGGYITGIYSCIYLAIYVLLNLAYSRGLKSWPLIDIAILASGYLIRVMYGGYITRVDISSWLYLTVMSGSLFMGMGKRRNEMKYCKGGGGYSRIVLNKYSYEFLDKNMYCCIIMTDVFYSLWAISKNNDFLLWSIPLFVFILMRYSFDIESDVESNPVEIFYKDKYLIAMCIVYAVLITSALYF